MMYYRYNAGKAYFRKVSTKYVKTFVCGQYEYSALPTYYSSLLTILRTVPIVRM
jgi:hypothetical protein